MVSLLMLTRSKQVMDWTQDILLMTIMQYMVLSLTVLFQEHQLAHIIGKMKYIQVELAEKLEVLSQAEPIMEIIISLLDLMTKAV